MKPTNRIRVALIFGGQSTEHQVSCITASEVAKAIDTDRFDIVGIGISPSGTWHRMTREQIAELYDGGRDLPELGDENPEVSLVRLADGVHLSNLHTEGADDQVDVALVLLHGVYGEDGTIQGLLEMLGLPYVGSGVAASAIGMDKHLMKVVLAESGLPIGRYEVVTARQWTGDQRACCDRIVSALDLPIYVKPARGGSSLGIVRVEDIAELPAAIEESLRYDPKLVVEQAFVNAREVEVAVLGPTSPDGQIRTSRPGEIKVHTDSAFYDFKAKYLPEGQVELVIPADLPTESEEQVRELASRCFEVLQSEGLARVDTFIADDGRAYISEINTMPGFTRLSMFPQAWEASGIGYRDLISDLIDQALARPANVIR